MIIIEETFTRDEGEVVRNTAPETGPANWTGSQGYVVNATGQLEGTTSGSGHLMGISLGADYFTDNPAIYELSADVEFSAESSDNTYFISIGFTENMNSSPGANRSHLSTSDIRFVGQPAIALRGNGEAEVTLGLSTLVNGTVGQFAPGQSYNLRLVLDTTLSNWTVDAFVDATQLDLNGAESGSTYTYATNPTATLFAGISSNIGAANTAEGTLDNFKLQVIPQPGPASLLLVGIMVMGFQRRRLAQAA